MRGNAKQSWQIVRRDSQQESRTNRDRIRANQRRGKKHVRKGELSRSFYWLGWGRVSAFSKRK